MMSLPNAAYTVATSSYSRHLLFSSLGRHVRIDTTTACNVSFSPVCSWPVTSLLQLSSLVLAEQRHGKLQPSTLHAITAAKQLGGDVTVLVAGKGIDAAAHTVSAIEGVNKVSCSSCRQHFYVLL